MQRDPEQSLLPLEPFGLLGLKTGQVANLDRFSGDRWHIGCGCQEGEDQCQDVLDAFLGSNSFG